MIARRRFLFGLSLLFAVGRGSHASAQTQGSVGHVDKVRGTASAEKAGSKRSLSADADVFVGDAISTGEESRVEMRLGRDSTLRLGEDAQLKIHRFRANAGGEITLGTGAILIDKSSDSAARPVRMRSPSAQIVVGGARVFAGPSQGVFGVFVAQGGVVVEAAGRRVRLRSGEGTDIASPGAAPTPPKRWGEPRIEAALASVDL